VSVELSILGALLSKCHLEVHKVELVLAIVGSIYIYFDHVIRMS
jgi:hypothetical protein